MYEKERARSVISARAACAASQLGLVDCLAVLVVSCDEDARIQAQLGEMAPYVKYLKKLKRMEGIQMRMPFEMDIR